jgi:hypothetical protein
MKCQRIIDNKASLKCYISRDTVKLSVMEISKSNIGYLEKLVLIIQYYLTTYYRNPNSSVDKVTCYGLENIHLLVHCIVKAISLKTQWMNLTNHHQNVCILTLQILQAPSGMMLSSGVGSFEGLHLSQKSEEWVS